MESNINGQEKQNNKFIQMTTAPVKKLVATLAMPTIFSMLVTSFYNMADTFFVGDLGTSATGAVGVVFSVMAIIQAIGFFFGHGSGNYISRKLGAKREDEAFEMASTGFVFAFLAGIILAVLGLIFIEPLAMGLGSTKTILPYATSYLRFILCGTPFIIGGCVLNNQLRFQGNAFYGMIGLTSGAFINIGLDPFFIFVLDMGVSGAGLATMLSQMISFGILFVVCRKKSIVPILLRRSKPSLKIMKEIFRGGFPSLCRQGMASIATICLNHKAGIYGDAAIAAMSVVTRITMFAASAVIGFGQGFQPVCGFNYGAGKYMRVKEAYWFSVKICTAFLAVMSILGVIFAPQLIALFRKEDLQVIEIGTLALRLQCFVLPVMGFIMPSNMMVQTIGKAVKASILAAARQFLFYLPALFILEPALGLLGIQMTQTVADVLACILTIPIVRSVLKEFNLDSSQDERTSL